MTKKLLTINGDIKTKKGTKLGVLTGILYLAPFNLSGFQVSPKATEGCKAACLFTAGRGVYQQVQQSRIAKTRFFFEARDEFMATIVSNIEALIRKANRQNMIPAVRMNGTSDIAWEKIKCIRGGKEYRSVMHAFPEVNFYDYTKVANRKGVADLPNYHLTFSLSENNDKDAHKALENGMNISVVFRVGRKGKLPTKWNGIKVIDGDTTDVRFLDYKGGCVVGLRMKGRARKDTSGFVRSVDSKF
jgi:hypothetical protein